MLVMELAQGGALFAVVGGGTPVDEERARGFFQQMLAAVEYCHGQGVCHRDLKLENIVLASAASDAIKVTDFGVSKDTNLSQPKTSVGTIAYMAPEVTAVSRPGAPETYEGPPVDVWALGVILYVMCSCSYPFGFDGPRRVGGLPVPRVYGPGRPGAVKRP